MDIPLRCSVYKIKENLISYLWYLFFVFFLFYIISISWLEWKKGNVKWVTSSLYKGERERERPAISCCESFVAPARPFVSAFEWMQSYLLVSTCVCLCLYSFSVAERNICRGGCARGWFNPTLFLNAWFGSPNEDVRSFVSAGIHSINH